MPTYRRPDRMLRLVDALERQTLDRDRFEVVVVDDSSPHAEADRLRERLGASPLQARLLSTPVNGGPAVARNLGWRAAAAPLLAFTDDDCVPHARWLEAGIDAFARDPSIGVAQGRTIAPPGAAPVRERALLRVVDAPTPWFEACNVFYRRSALAGTDGFDEELRMAFEDTVPGWAVLEAGWRRAFVDDAVVEHDIDDRGVWWHMTNGYRERRNMASVVARFPSFREEAFWRPWAFRPQTFACTLLLVGMAAGVRWRPALVLAAPYVLRWRDRPRRDHPRYWQVIAEQFAIDAAKSAGHVVGSVRHRVVVL